MPYYPAISLLAVYPVEMHSCIHQMIHTRMIIAALFITVKNWIVPKWALAID